MQRTGQRTGIVVGVDGSPSSWDALHWAVGEAHRWRAPLEVLIVDEGQGASGARTSGSRLAQMVADARRLEPAVRVTGTVGHGNVVPALCEASRTARMLVVGHRGHSRFGSGVAAVLAYLHPAGPWMTRGQPPPSDPSLLHASACTTLEATVAPWREKYPRIPIRTLTASATAATFLAVLSRRAQLVVVGAHGCDVPTGPLGSVPAGLVRHAHCPVLIAR